MTQTAQVAQAFDTVAEIFESEFENDITRSIRKTVMRTIHCLVPSGSSILDINCGTGIDAIALAKAGYDVVGIDVSPKMVAQARHNAVKQNLSAIRFRISSFENLADVRKPYDLVLSNFGGLNCVANLDAVAAELASVTTENGYVVAIVMPPFCLWETVTGLLSVRPGYAFRRLRKRATATGFRGRTFTVHYHSPRAVASSIGASFTVTHVEGIRVLSPPPQATQFVAAFPRLTSILEKADAAVASLPLLRSIGDHYLIVLRRVSA